MAQSVLRVADAPGGPSRVSYPVPPPESARPVEQKYWTRAPEDMLDEGKMPTRVFQVLLALVRHFRSNERDIQLPTQRTLALACHCKERTIRSALKYLEEKLGYIRRYRDLDQPGQPWRVELTFKFRGQLYLESPPAVRGPQSKGKKTPRQEIAAPPAETGRAPGKDRPRPRQGSAAPTLWDLETGPKQEPKETTTTVDCAPPAHGPDPEPPPPSSSSSSDSTPDPGGPEEAPGTPQEATASGRDETPAPPSEKAVAAARAREIAARAFPGTHPEVVDRKLRDLCREWKGARERGGEPCSATEAVRIAGLAVEYAELMGPGKRWGYAFDTLRRWAYVEEGWELEDVEREVQAYRKAEKATAAPVVEAPKPPRVVETPEEAKAKADTLRALVAAWAIKDPEERAAAIAALEEAQAEGRRPGVSASPTGGPE